MFKNSTLSKDVISALVITFNEEDNIHRTLSSLAWVPDVLIIDSGSTDNTLPIISSFSNTRVIYRKFDTFAQQCNFGLSCLSSEWVLSLDADYVLTPELSREICRLLRAKDDNDVNVAYQIRFQYCINGRPIRSGLLPPRTCLYKKNNAVYVDQGHGHRVVINGHVGSLQNKMYHDDRKSVTTWLLNQSRYQKSEAIMLSGSRSANLPLQDLIRKHTFLAPFSAFFLCIFLRGGFLDGKEGVIYAFQRFIAEGLLFIYMHLKTNQKS
jgi:glycosyltransferase involved in cell wall biosynthesis